MTDAQVFHAALEDLLHRESPFHPKVPECPNCYQLHDTFVEKCTVENLLAVCDITDEERYHLLDNLNVDAFWQAVGPILDDLQAGAFSE